MFPTKKPKTQCQRIFTHLKRAGQHAKGLPEQAGNIEEEPAALRAEAEKRPESLKWYLWHGNVFQALEEIEDLQALLDDGQDLADSGEKLAKAIDEFLTYIQASAPFIPNYGERWRNNEIISSSFVASTVN